MQQADRSFSKRFNHQRAKTIQVREDAPPALRSFVARTIRHFYPYNTLARDLVCMALKKIPPSSAYGHRQDEWRLMEDELARAPWYQIYDVLERFHALSKRTNNINSIDLSVVVNHFFEENGYAFRLTPDSQIEYRGEESFEVAVGTADLALTAAGLETARSEIHKALEDLGKRPFPDLTGAVQHAIAGLECAAKDIAGESQLELGKIVKKRPDLFPPPLGEVIAQLYGYASNNGRHLTEGEEPDVAEVELVVGIATTCATYLARKKVSD